nr:MAG: nonstructural polyprotein [Wufeng shrew bastrovirus 2]
MELKPTYTAELTDRLGGVLAGPLLKIAEQRVASAYYIKTQLSASEMAILKSFASTDLFYSKQIKLSSHPLPSALLEFANLEANKLYKGRSDWIEIGPNLLDYTRRANSTTHCCTLMDNARDDGRLYHSAMSVHLSRNGANVANAMALKSIVAAVKSGVGNRFCCVRGAHNCMFSAVRALSIHSAYDIPFDQWYRIFDFHGLQEADLWMLLPPQILALQNFECPEEGFWFKTIGDKIVMGFYGDSKLDSSFCYHHDRANLECYLKSSVINGPEFSVVCEIVGRRGPQVHIRMTKAHHGGEIFRMVSTGLSEYARLPRMQAVVENRYRKTGFTDCDYVLVPRKKFATIIQYAESRADGVDSLTFDKLATFARAQINRITIGSVDVESAWSISEKDFSDVMQSIYVVAICRRMQRTSLVGDAIKRLGTEKGADLDWLLNFTLWVKDRGADFADMIIGRKKLFTQNLHTILGLLDPERAIMCYDRVKACPRYVSRTYDICEDKDYYQTFVEPLHCPQTPTAPGAEPANDVDTVDADKTVPLPVISEGAWAAFREGLLRGAVEHEENAATLSRVLKKAADSLGKAVPRFLEDRKSDWGDDTVVTDARDRITFLDGGPGTGKTTYYLKHLATGAADVIVTPTAELANEIRQKLPDKASSPKVFTLHSALSATKGKRYGTVVVDECHLLPWTYIAALLGGLSFEQCYLAGDPKQIGFIDFDKSYITCADELRLSQGMKAFKQLRLTKCWRCPKDVVAILNTHFGYKLQAMSGVESSITICENEDSPRKGVQLLTFTRHAKSKCMEYATAGLNTCHEVQGRTYAQTQLVITEDAELLLNRSPAHIIVAITRHSEHMFVSSENKKHLMICHLDHKADDPKNIALVHSDAHGDMHLHETEKHHAEVVTDTLVVDGPLEETGVFDPATIDKILCKVMPCDRGEADYRHVNVTMIPPVDKGVVFKVNKDTFAEPEREISGRGLDGRYFAKRFSPQDRVATMQAMGGRYGNRTVNPISRIAGKRLARKMLNKSYATWFKQRPVIDHDNLAREMFKALKGMQDRGTIGQVKEIEPSMKEFRRVQFFLKKIDKIKMAPGAGSSAKVGQGISSVSKEYVAMFGPLIRALEDAVRHALHDNVYFVNGQDDERFQHSVDACMDGGEGVNCADDISEQDRCYSEVLVEIECLLMKDCGVSPYLIDFYREVRREWFMTAPGIAELRNIWHMQSGGPWTWFFNTFGGACIRSFYLEIRGLIVALFGGDDAGIRAKAIRKSAVEAEYLEKELGIKTKFEYTDILSFTSQFWTPQGCLPDLVKYAAKAYTRVFKDEIEFQTYQTGVRDWFRHCDSAEKRRAAVAYTAEFHTIHKNDAGSCLSFLDAFRRLNWESYCKYGSFRYLWIVNVSEKIDDEFFVALNRKSVSTLTEYKTFKDEYLRSREDDPSGVSESMSAAVPGPSVLESLQGMCGMGHAGSIGLAGESHGLFVGI